MPRPKKSDAAKAVQQPPTPVVPAMAPSPYSAPPMAQPPLQPTFQAQFQPVAPQFAAPPPMPVGPRTVDVESFLRVRDSVNERFNTILVLVKGFSDDFMRQTSLLLGEPAAFDSNSTNAMSQMVANLDSFSGQLNNLAAGGAPFEEGKKERKKRTHDPNAPKRPLTPYFLYMQTARPIISKDLGEEAPKGAVQAEGQRRWAAMQPNDKVAWNNAYQFNLRLYNARVHSYKNGNPEAREMTDQEAHAYADRNEIPQPPLSSEDTAIPATEQDAVNEQLGMAASIPAPAVPVPASPEETKTPKPKATRKRKSTAAADAAEEGEASAAKVSTPANPEKKRKRQSKVAETPVEEPKKSARKKKNA